MSKTRSAFNTKQTAEQKEKLAQYAARQAEARKACIADKKPLAPLVEVFERRGVDGLISALLPVLPLHSTAWTDLRCMIPPNVVDYQRDGVHLYGLYGITLEPELYLPTDHPIVQLIKPTKRTKAATTSQSWLLCSICGKPIRADLRSDAKLVLTLCPEIIPQISGSPGWLVKTINLGKIKS